MAWTNRQLHHFPLHALQLLTHAPLVMVRKRSCPAVSQICSFTHLLSNKIFLILKSILPGGGQR